MLPRPAPNSRWEHRKSRRVAAVVTSRIDPGHVFYQYVAPVEYGPVVRMRLERFYEVFRSPAGVN